LRGGGGGVFKKKFPPRGGGKKKMERPKNLKKNLWEKKGKKYPAHQIARKKNS